MLTESECRPEAAPSALLNEFVTPAVALASGNEKQFKQAVQYRRKKIVQLIHVLPAISSSLTAGIVAGGSDEDDDARTEYNRGEVPADASGPTPALTTITPRRLRDLPVRRRAAANTIPRSQPVASMSQSSLMVICDVAIIPCGQFVLHMSSEHHFNCYRMCTLSCMQN